VNEKLDHQAISFHLLEKQSIPIGPFQCFTMVPTMTMHSHVGLTYESR
jgi:hypothetical protein